VITTLIGLFIILAVASLIWWGINALPLPPTVKVVVQVIVGLICLVFLWNLFAGGGAGSLRLR
jgi:Na+/glutamate symporter